MPKTIRIVSIPDGEGLPYIREPYVGCTFRLADPATVAEVEALHFSELEAAPPPAYSVAFDEVIRGLQEVQRYDWASHLQMLVRPKFIRFPVDCAELVRS